VLPTNNEQIRFNVSFYSTALPISLLLFSKSSAAPSRFSVWWTGSHSLYGRESFWEANSFSPSQQICQMLEIWIFIIVITKACHLHLPWARSIHSTVSDKFQYYPHQYLHLLPIHTVTLSSIINIIPPSVPTFTARSYCHSQFNHQHYSPISTYIYCPFIPSLSVPSSILFPHQYLRLPPDEC
jgi:hypothetical protein